jgi:hypothetical protein
VYAWIWRRLPGPWWARLLTSLALSAGLVAFLWFLAFPWAEPLLPFDDVQVGNGTAPAEVVPSQDVSPNPTTDSNPEPGVSPSVAG